MSLGEILAFKMSCFVTLYNERGKILYIELVKIVLRFDINLWNIVIIQEVVQ